MNRSSVVMTAIALTATISCGGDGPSGPSLPVAEPGNLTLTLALPAGDDRAALLTITGPNPIGTITSANPAYTVHSRASGTSAKVAVFGRLQAGPIVRFDVPDVKMSASYSATVVEIAGPVNELRDQTTGYTLAVGR